MSNSARKSGSSPVAIQGGVNEMPSVEITGRDGPEILLIVEDSPTQAMELRLILDRAGFSTSVAANGKEALAWLSSNRPAMIISDIVMPELDGYQLCQAIREDGKLKGVPVVLLSFLSEVSDVLKGLESGASNFIVKPYNADRLISFVREELSRTSGGREELLEPPVAMDYKGQKFLVSSNVRHILNILLATYGTAVSKNEELLKAENELRLLNENLEEKIRERTVALTAEIAERRRMEEELRKKTEELAAYSAKLEQSNRDLQDFAFVASHDLQEPLRKIQTFAGRLKTRCSGSLDEMGCDDLERVGRSARRMQELIRALLRYSQLASNAEEFATVALNRVVEEALLDLRMVREDTGARIEIGNLPVIEADPVQMRQLFQNLLGNALKYHGEQAPLIRVHAGPGRCEGFHEIRVEDNGIGFDECYLESIFKPFRRLHGRSAPYEGTGMGLAICRRIVERHGGTITARGKPDTGAVFVVNLPERQTGPEITD